MKIIENFLLPDDWMHAVTQITSNKKRKSIVLFLKEEYFL